MSILLIKQQCQSRSYN